MSIEKSVEASENIFRFPQIEPESNTDNTLIFKENSRELEKFLLRENNKTTPIRQMVFSSSWRKY